MMQEISTIFIHYLQTFLCVYAAQLATLLAALFTGADQGLEVGHFHAVFDSA